MKRERYLGLKDAAWICGLTPRELLYKAERGDIPCGRDPGTKRVRRFRESDMLRLREMLEASFQTVD